MMMRVNGSCNVWSCKEIDDASSFGVLCKGCVVLLLGDDRCTKVQVFTPHGVGWVYRGYLTCL